MKLPELPPMPWTSLMLSDPEGGEPFGTGYTEDEMRSFALHYAESVREACARECDRVRAVSAVSYETGAACAAAIRMKEE